MLGQLSNPWWTFLVLGIFAGIASGLLGIGGGVIMVPALVLFFGSFGQKTAQGTALAVMIPMAIVGTLRYMQNPNVTINWTVVIFITVGAVIGTLTGTALVAKLPVIYLRKFFAFLLLIIAVKMFISKPSPKNPQMTNQQTQKEVNSEETQKNG